MKDHNGRLTRCYISLLPFKTTIRPPLIGKCQHGGRSLLQVAKQHQPLGGDGCCGRAAALSVLLHGVWVVLALAVSHTHTYPHPHKPPTHIRTIFFFSIFYHNSHHQSLPLPQFLWCNWGCTHSWLSSTYMQTHRQTHDMVKNATCHRSPSTQRMSVVLWATFGQCFLIIIVCWCKFLCGIHKESGTIIDN